MTATRSKDYSGEFMNILCVCLHRPVGTCVQCPLCIMHAAMETEKITNWKSCYCCVTRRCARNFKVSSWAPMRRFRRMIPTSTSKLKTNVKQKTFQSSWVFVSERFERFQSAVLFPNSTIFSSWALQLKQIKKTFFSDCVRCGMDGLKSSSATDFQFKVRRRRSRVGILCI